MKQRSKVSKVPKVAQVPKVPKVSSSQNKLPINQKQAIENINNKKLKTIKVFLRRQPPLSPSRLFGITKT